MFTMRLNERFYDMFISDAIDHLNSSLGLSLSSSYYAHVGEWLDWWRGFHEPFHVYSETGASGSPVRRELYKLRMAKKICQDWASILLNEKTTISCSDPAASAFLLGSGGALESEADNSDASSGEGSSDNESSSDGEKPAKGCDISALLRRANHLLELAFATGTGAVITRLENAALSPDGKAVPGAEPRIAYEFVDASHIIPITVRHGEVVEAAFVSETMQSGSPALYIETHLLEDGHYRIKNEYFTYDGDGALRPAPLPEGVAPELVTPNSVPMFALVSPNIANDIDPLCGLGVSVFADAIDCLKGVDLAFNNFCRDLKLGGKKVFLSQTLINRDEYGNAFTPDDIAQQLFQTVGETGFSDHPLIVEHNPELRTDENAAAVQHQLDYLSFKCGLGAKYFSFSAGMRNVTMTAAQYNGERQDLVRSAARHSQNVRSMLEAVLRSTLVCARYFLGVPLAPSCAISVRFDDGFLSDDDTIRSRDLEEVRLGIMTREEYRSKYNVG